MTPQQNCDDFLAWCKTTSLKQSNADLRPEMWIALAHVWSSTK